MKATGAMVPFVLLWGISFAQASEDLLEDEFALL